MSDPSPSPEEEYSGKLQIRCDYQTYRAFYYLADNYYSYEDALTDLLRVAKERPDLLRRPVGDGTRHSRSSHEWG